MLTLKKTTLALLTLALTTSTAVVASPEGIPEDVREEARTTSASTRPLTAEDYQKVNHAWQALGTDVFTAPALTKAAISGGKLAAVGGKAVVTAVGAKTLIAVPVAGAAVVGISCGLDYMGWDYNGYAHGVCSTAKEGASSVGSTVMSVAQGAYEYVVPEAIREGIFFRTDAHQLRNVGDLGVGLVEAWALNKFANWIGPKVASGFGWAGGQIADGGQFIKTKGGEGLGWTGTKIANGWGRTKNFVSWAFTKQVVTPEKVNLLTDARITTLAQATVGGHAADFGTHAFGGSAEALRDAVVKALTQLGNGADKATVTTAITNLVAADGNAGNVAGYVTGALDQAWVTNAVTKTVARSWWPVAGTAAAAVGVGSIDYSQSSLQGMKVTVSVDALKTNTATVTKAIGDTAQCGWNDFVVPTAQAGWAYAPEKTSVLSAGKTAVTTPVKKVAAIIDSAVTLNSHVRGTAADTVVAVGGEARKGAVDAWKRAFPDKTPASSKQK